MCLKIVCLKTIRLKMFLFEDVLLVGASAARAADQVRLVRLVSAKVGAQLVELVVAEGHLSRIDHLKILSTIR